MPLLLTENSRSHGSVSMKVSEMGLKTPKPKYWSDEEIELIKKLYPVKMTAEIASQLGRSVLVVRGKKCIKSALYSQINPAISLWGLDTQQGKNHGWTEHIACCA